MFSKVESTILIVSVLVLVIIVCIGAILWTSRTVKKQENDQTQSLQKNAKVHFMIQDEARRFISADADGYIRYMSAPDLHARHVDTRVQYIERATKACSDFTPAEKRRIRSICNSVDTYIAENSLAVAVEVVVPITVEEYDSDDEVLNIDLAQKDMFITQNDIQQETPTKQKTKSLTWTVNEDLLKNLPWIFIKTNSKAYEDGLPHTRGPNVICLSTQTLRSKNDVLARTLLHEKIHIYQRIYPIHTADAIKAAGYNKTNIKRTSILLARANPDLDEWIYEDTNKNPMIFVYNSATPSGINDISDSNGVQEHPYETMAYLIANKIETKETINVSL
jgi:hypothetical protein